MNVRQHVSRCNPGGGIRGWLIEEMATGVERINGTLSNSSFGPLVMVGLGGGVHAELFRAVARRYAPFDAQTARELVLSLKGAPLLQGYRGKAACEINALARTPSRVS